MFPINDEYINYIKKGRKPPNGRIEGFIKLKNGTTLDINSNNLILGTLNINNKACGSSDLQIGTTYIGECKFNYKTDLYLYDFYDAEVNFIYKNDVQDIPLGVFYISNVERKNKILYITGYDGMSKLDENVGNMTTNGVPYSVLKWIEKNTGITLKNTEEEINNMVNSEKIVNVSSNVYSTFRDVLADISSILCGFATFNRYGQLEIRQYKTEPNATLYVMERKAQKLAEYKSYYTELDATVDNIAYVSISGSNDGLKYQLSNKMIMGTIDHVQDTLDDIMRELAKIKYTPASYDIVFNPIYDLGDMVNVIADGNVIKKDINTLITEISYTHNGANSIKGVGANIFLSKRNNKSNSNSAYNSATANTKNNGTYIKLYENIEAYNITGNSKKRIVSIDYANGSSDCIVLHGQCCINVSTAGTITVIYGVDEKEEIFKPKQYLTTGYHIIDFYCYFKEPMENWLSNYTVDILGDGNIKGIININDIRADVTATTFSDGRFVINNIFNEVIPYYSYEGQLDIYGNDYLEGGADEN